MVVVGYLFSDASRKTLKKQIKAALRDNCSRVSHRTAKATLTLDWFSLQFVSVNGKDVISFCERPTPSLLLMNKQRRLFLFL